jgi:hypothetical protein
MLIVALVLAVIGLAALVTAVVTSNELVAWVCIAASVLGVILLIIDAIRERQRGGAAEAAAAEDAAADGDSIERTYQNFDAEYPDEDETPESADVPADKRSDATDEAKAEGAESEPALAEPAESAEAESEPEAEHEPKTQSESESKSETRPSANG